MPNQITIKRIEIITVAGQGVVNQYGDMAFKATNGNEYKLGKKRNQYFGLIQPGKTVKLSFAEYMSKEFIAEVAAAEPQSTSQQAPEAQNKGTRQTGQYNSSAQSKQPPQNVSGAEKGMMIKEAGDYFRSGKFTPENQPELWAFIKSEMGRVLGVRVN